MGNDDDGDDDDDADVFCAGFTINENHPATVPWSCGAGSRALVTNSCSVCLGGPRKMCVSIRERKSLSESHGVRLCLLYAPALGFRVMTMRSYPVEAVEQSK